MRKLVAVFTAILMLTAAGAGFFQLEGSKAAIVQLEGSITPSAGGIGSDGITPEKVRSLNSKALEQGADAIVYEWNSGGGAVVASKEVMRAIKDVEKPTICRFRDVAASGAYLSSLGCDRIVADSATLTGSIGVTSSYMEFSGTLDKLGIEYVNISSGKHKEVGSQYQNASKEDIRMMRQKAVKVHREFLNHVRENRELNESQMEEIETGKLILGSEAEELGMVDSIGGREKAIMEAENMTGTELSTFNVRSDPPLSILSLLTADLSFKQLMETGSPLKAEWR